MKNCCFIDKIGAAAEEKERKGEGERGARVRVRSNLLAYKLNTHVCVCSVDDVGDSHDFHHNSDD